MSCVAIPWWDGPEIDPQAENEAHCQWCFLIYLRALGACPHHEKEDEHQDPDVDSVRDTERDGSQGDDRAAGGGGRAGA